MKRVALVLLALIFGLPLANGESPYAGQELRSIKSLSSDEIESLKFGEGMGFAKLAELNHYPGPKHVLDIADDLDLTPSQLDETEALFEEMRLNAVALGEELLTAEMGLNRDFERATISRESLGSALHEIGKMRAQLRFVHLEAHLRQQRMLTAEQIAKYDEVRGYGSAAHDQSGHPKSHN